MSLEAALSTRQRLQNTWTYSAPRNRIVVA